MLLQSKPSVGICTDLFILGNNMREKKCSLCLWLPYIMLQMDCIRNGVIMMYSSVHTVFCPIKYNLLLISACYLHYTSHEPNCSTIYIVVNPINDQNVCFFYLEQHQFLQNNSFKKQNSFVFHHPGWHFSGPCHICGSNVSTKISTTNLLKIF
jgi:hypothetical protein